MANKQVALELATFLDSERAGQVEGVSREDVQRVAQAFLEVCYDELGKKPRLLDGHDVHVALGHLLPSRLKRADPIAPQVPALLTAFFDHLEETQVVTQTFEIRRSLEATTDEFLECVRTGQAAHHGHKQDPFVHGAPKLGRNDPCSCGSGKKYKKCHGKNA